MEQNGIVAYREKLQQVVDKYGDFLGEEVSRLGAEHGIPTAEKLQADLAAIAEEERLLRIGIVGRVKSGKSSLLNALIFGGESVLPKAATPMTAALTTLSYGDAMQAEVEFFTRGDIEDIAAKAGEYERLLKKKTDELLKKQKSRSLTNLRGSVSPENRERLQRRAEREMRDNHPVLLASHEQHDKIKRSGVFVGSLEERKVLNLSGDLSGLQDQLKEYVGADGKYMPFTKSVNIRLPQENLQDIVIVDTPGINDPIQSREARTQEYLSQCDVVLVVSPSGQFISDQDMELMDRITNKEGIRELYVVAAQVDTQLFGSAKTENAGQLDRVLDHIVEQLGDQLETVIENLKKSNPEVGDTYDQLLEGKGRIIYAAGLCESMRQRFEEQDGWDEGMAHVWGNLQAGYPDFFTEETALLNLDKLSNIAAIREKVAQVRGEKDRIIEDRVGDYLQDKGHALRELNASLLRYVGDRQAEIEGSDVERLREQRKELETSLEKVDFDIEEARDESVDSIGKSMIGELKKRIEEETQKVEDVIGSTRGTRTEEYEEGIIFKRKGTRVHETIRPKAVVKHLSNFCEDRVEEIMDKIQEKKKDWRQDLTSRMTKVLRAHFSDDKLEAIMIRRVIKKTVEAIDIPDFEFDNRMPSELKAQGELEGDEAKEFFDAACDHAGDICRSLRKEGRSYIERFTADMKKMPLAKLLLEGLQKDIAALENSIENKEMELKRIGMIKGELDGIKEAA